MKNYREVYERRGYFRDISKCHPERLNFQKEMVFIDYHPAHYSLSSQKRFQILNKIRIYTGGFIELAKNFFFSRIKGIAY